MRAGGTWRQVAYHLPSSLISVGGGVAMLMAWAGCLVAAALAVSAWAAGGTWEHVPLVLLALALLVAGPWLAHGVTDLDRLAAEALLGPGRPVAFCRCRRVYLGRTLTSRSGTRP